MDGEAQQTAALLRLAQQGDQRAASAIFDRYATRLACFAEQHLSRKLAARLDGEDVVQSVFRTFFRRSAAGEFRLDSSAHLWRLLVRITVCKARAKARHHLADCRDAGAELAGTGEPALLAVLAEEPGPDEAVALMDQIEALLRGLPPLYCRVLELRLEGCGPTEIASALGVTRQT